MQGDNLVSFYYSFQENVCSWKNFVFWQCSLLIGSASSLECNQCGCGVVHLAMPGPASGCFVMTKNVRQHKIVKGGKLQKSGSSLICVVIAERSTNASPESTSVLAHFCIPISLHKKNVLLRCLINEILWLVIEVGRSFRPVREGIRRFRPPRVSQF